MRKALRVGLGLLVLGSGVALVMVYQAEKISRHEHDWRMGTNKYFQDDFKPWEKK